MDHIGRDPRIENLPSNYTEVDPSFVTSLSEVNVFEYQRLLVERRRLAPACIVPGGDVAEAGVVALGFAVGYMVFMPTMGLTHQSHAMAAR